jgi:hypothetical protein
MIVAGNHIYQKCGYCGRYIKVTGWFHGIHLCVTPEERAAIDKQIAKQLKEMK